MKKNEYKNLKIIRNKKTKTLKKTKIKNLNQKKNHF